MRKPSSSPPKSVCLIALAAACTSGDAPGPESDFSVTVDTVGGIAHVVNSGAPPEWRVVQVASLGPESLTDEGAPEEFGNVSAVALGPDGAVFVADVGNHEVRVFGVDGAHRHTFGRDGEGPGEFRSLYSLAWVGDRLMVYDPHLGRIGEFSASGEWLGQRGVAGGVTGSQDLLRLYHVGPDEAYHFDISADNRWVGLDSQGETGDTLAFMSVPTRASVATRAVILCEAGGVIGYFANPFAPRWLQFPGRDAVWNSGWTDTYRFAVTTASGDTLRVVERVLASEPVSDEEWSTASAEHDEFMERYPDASCNPRSFSRPDSKPLVQDALLAPDGRLWVEVIRDAGNRWEIIDSEGRLLGSVPAGPRKERTVPAFRGDYMATIRQDELDLDHVDVWRIEPEQGD